ncbi:MAG: rod shape-determining protein MreC [Lachnospiraceae bacterium]
MSKEYDIFSAEKERPDNEASSLVDATDEPLIEKTASRGLKDFLNNFKIHKSPGKKEPFKMNSKLLFGILAVICLVLIVLSALYEEVARPFKYVASAIVVPAQSGVNVVGSWISDRLDEINTVRDIAAENERLRSEIIKLRTTNNELRQQLGELDRYKNLLNIRSEYSEYETIAATIISKDASKWFSLFTVNKGYEDGIQQNMNVVAHGGLVGVVSDVGRNYATVRTIINDDSNISAMFEFSTDLCIVSGNLSSMDSNIIDFTNASITANIKEGDAVVTSSVSSICLPGLLIGYVTDFQIDGNELTQSGHITPVVDFDNLSEILIITSLKETSD